MISAPETSRERVSDAELQQDCAWAKRQEDHDHGKSLAARVLCTAGRYALDLHDARSTTAALCEEIESLKRERDEARRCDYRTATLGGMSLLDQINRARNQRDELASDLAKERIRADEAWLAGWQPIETAPKDGTHILVLFRHPMWRKDDPLQDDWQKVCVTRWIGMWAGSAYSPIIWRPLPASPRVTSEEQS